MEEYLFNVCFDYFHFGCFKHSFMIRKQKEIDYTFVQLGHLYFCVFNKKEINRLNKEFEQL